MDATKIAVAERCLSGAQSGDLDFPAIVELLAAEDFDGYFVDYRAGTVVYYLADGEATILKSTRHHVTVPAIFEATTVAAAIREAQQKVPGYSYSDFSKKVMTAGCAGYLVSLSGRCVVYFGRSGENHIENMPI